MTVYVDNFRIPARVGRIYTRWSHLTADTREELHAFAESIGLRRAWFQDKGDGRWHYDVTDSKREEAIRKGAKPVDIRELGAIIRQRAIPEKERSERARNAARARWAKADETARVENAKRGQAGLMARFVREADPRGELPEAERLARAHELLAAHMSATSRIAWARRNEIG